MRLRFLSLLALSLVSLMLAATPASAVRPDEMLADPHLEARARQVSEELRCLVCRNQSIDDSDADLAHDLRLLVRRRIMSGDSNAQVIAYIRSRYGDFVLLKPPFQTDTLLLWGLPPLALLAGIAGLLVMARKRRSVKLQPEALSPDEQAKVATLVEPAGSKP